jgi:myosin-crossreactive antigen
MYILSQNEFTNLKRYLLYFLLSLKLLHTFASILKLLQIDTYEVIIIPIIYDCFLDKNIQMLIEIYYWWFGGLYIKFIIKYG